MIFYVYQFLTFPVSEWEYSYCSDVKWQGHSFNSIYWNKEKKDKKKASKNFLPAQMHDTTIK